MQKGCHACDFIARVLVLYTSLKNYGAAQPFIPPTDVWFIKKLGKIRAFLYVFLKKDEFIGEYLY